MERGGENSALMKILSYFAKHTLKQQIFQVILEF